MNPRITKKEQGMLKGAIRRVFSRSDLHKAVLTKVSVEHSDPNRPRVKHWAYCESCGEVMPRYKLSVDHIEPIIALDSSFEKQWLDITVNRAWCPINMLQALCNMCHDLKTSAEREQRKKHKNE